MENYVNKTNCIVVRGEMLDGHVYTIYKICMVNGLINFLGQRKD